MGRGHGWGDGTCPSGRLVSSRRLIKPRHAGKTVHGAR